MCLRNHADCQTCRRQYCRLKGRLLLSVIFFIKTVLPQSRVLPLVASAMKGTKGCLLKLETHFNVQMPLEDLL